MYLQAYSPDLTPILRSREVLVEAKGATLKAITIQDARGFFRPLQLPCIGPVSMRDAPMVEIEYIQIPHEPEVPVLALTNI